MAEPNERGARSERGSALWGTGKGGDRASVLWGKGGRGFLVAAIAAVALTVSFATTAAAGNGKGNPAPPPAPPAASPSTDPAPPDASNGSNRANWVAKDLLDRAKGAPNQLVNVIISASGGSFDADLAAKWLAMIAAKTGDSVGGEQPLNLVNGVTLTLPAKLVTKLQNVPGLTVTPNAPVKLLGSLSSSQMWPYETGNALAWPGDLSTYAGKDPAIAIVDSGIEHRSAFGNRIVADVNLSTMAGNTAADTGTTDQNGHGTFVAGIAAGADSDLAGAAPGAPLVDVKVMNSQGQALTSDVINACQWILDNKAQYNIRVANFSLHSSWGTNSYRDPLDQAVEKLWFNGVVVVAASGNYGTAGTPSGVLYSPGNDPFVITVGAIDIGHSIKVSDDSVAPWSAYGYTEDGFWKPELGAPGRYMVGPIPVGSYITTQKPSNMVGTDRIQLSGTSFAAPVVAGTVADMLARHPGWTPDQVKGVLMRTAKKVSVGDPRAAGAGELTASRALIASYAPNPNLQLDQFVSTPTGGTSPVWDWQSWANAAKANMSWNSQSWSSQSWSDQSWSDQSWASYSGTTMSWSSMSWSDQSWSDLASVAESSTDMVSEDAAEGDSLAGTDGYVATTTTPTDTAADPDTAVPVDGTNPTVALGLTP